MEDSQIIDLYFERNEEAISESNVKYGRYCHSVAYAVLSDDGDSEECVSDTWMKAWNSIPPTMPKVLKMFFAKITRNLAFDRFRSEHAKKRGSGEVPLVLEELSECIPGQTSVEDSVNAAELGKLIELFLKTIPKRDGDIFLRRYFFAEEIAAIAKRYGVRTKNVSLILGRTRKKLKDYLEKEGVII